MEIIAIVRSNRMAVLLYEKKKEEKKKKERDRIREQHAQNNVGPVHV